MQPRTKKLCATTAIDYVGITNVYACRLEACTCVALMRQLTMWRSNLMGVLIVLMC